MARKYVPQLITANRLLDGVIVYKKEKGWSEDLKEGFICTTQEKLDAHMKEAEKDEAKQQVVAIYSFPVEEDEGSPEPLSMREKIRHLGKPTVKLFNKEIEELNPILGERHVSL